MEKPIPPKLRIVHEGKLEIFENEAKMFGFADDRLNMRYLLERMEGMNGPFDVEEERGFFGLGHRYFIILNGNGDPVSAKLQFKDKEAALGIAETLNKIFGYAEFT